MPSTTSAKVLTPTGTSGVAPLPADFPSAVAVLSKSTDLVYLAAALNVLVLSADLNLYLKDLWAVLSEFHQGFAAYHAALLAAQAGFAAEAQGAAAAAAAAQAAAAASNKKASKAVTPVPTHP
ncbi:MAG: hypothetical protein WDW38_005554 [Sanguina aurantia]